MKEIPSFGYGTYDLRNADTQVYDALKLGYRHVDAASFYENEALVGKAMAKAIDEKVVSRDQLWVTSKAWILADTDPASLKDQLKKTMEDLKVDYLDMYLFHWPVDTTSKSKWSNLDHWKELEKFKDEGLVRGIGLSNFTIEETREILAKCKHRPTEAQFECHPWLQQDELRAFLKAEGIHGTAFRPMGIMFNGLEPPKEIVDIAAKHKVTPPQVMLKWSLQLGNAVMPKAASPSHMKDNIDTVRIQLDGDDMENIKSLQNDPKNRVRLINPGRSDGGKTWWS
eukprot:Polyplicarium_translucidae@DN2791_c0_g1_i1.p1